MKPENRTTNLVIHPMKIKPAAEDKKDLHFRIALILVFGIAAIAFAARRKVQAGHNFFACLYALSFAVLVLEGNRYLWKLIGSRLEWHRGPAKRIGVMVFVILLYTCLLSMLAYQGWQALFGRDSINDIQGMMILVFLLVWMFIITHFYETAYLVRKTASDVINREQLERLSVEAELELLKSQIDPHFIFNSLNTLSHLITANPPRALIFNDALADVFRYILLNRGKKLVALTEEVNFLNDYLFLLKIRFENAIQFDSFLKGEVLDSYLIPPISLQILLENAVKHNEFSAESPLIITLQKIEDRLVMTNKIRSKQLHRPTAGTGLRNLTDRYRHLTGITPEVSNQNDTFNVCLPIIKIN